MFVCVCMHVYASTVQVLLKQVRSSNGTSSQWVAKPCNKLQSYYINQGSATYGPQARPRLFAWSFGGIQQQKAVTAVTFPRCYGEKQWWWLSRSTCLPTCLWPKLPQSSPQPKKVASYCYKWYLLCIFTVSATFYSPVHLCLTSSNIPNLEQLQTVTS